MCSTNAYKEQNRLVAGQHVEARLGAITTQQIALRCGISRKTVEHRLQGKYSPHPSTLIPMMEYLFERGRERFWNGTPEELIHWLVLLGYSRTDILQLDTSDGWSAAWKDKIFGKWLEPQLTFGDIPWPDFDQLTSYRTSRGYDGEKIGDIQQQLTEALLTYKEFHRPAHRAIVIYGVNGIGKAELVAQLLDTPVGSQTQDDELPSLREYFFQGALWIDADKVDWIVQAGKDVAQKQPFGEEEYDGELESFYREEFTVWLTDDKSYWKLVVVENATPDDVEYLLSEADPRIRFIFLSPSRTYIETTVARFVKSEEGCFLEVPRLEAEEAVERLRHRSMPVPEHEEPWALQIAAIVGAPSILALLGQRAEYQGWKEVFARLTRRTDLLGNELRGEIQRIYAQEFGLVSDEQRKRLQQLAERIEFTETFTVSSAADAWTMRRDDARYELGELQQRGWIRETDDKGTFQLFWDRHFFLRSLRTGQTTTDDPNQDLIVAEPLKERVHRYWRWSVSGNGSYLVGALPRIMPPAVLGASTFALLFGVVKAPLQLLSSRSYEFDPEEHPWTVGNLKASFFDVHVFDASFPRADARRMLNATTALMWVVLAGFGALLLGLIRRTGAAAQWTAAVAPIAVFAAFFTLSLPLQIIDEHRPEADAPPTFEIYKRNRLLEKYPWQCRLLGSEMYLFLVVGVLGLIRIL